MSDRPDVPPGSNPEPAPGERGPLPSDLLVPLDPDARERVDRAAAALGRTAPDYARIRLVMPGPDVPAWRHAYHHVLTAIQEIDAIGVPPQASAVLRRMLDEFETVTADVFDSPVGDPAVGDPDPEGGD